MPRVRRNQHYNQLTPFERGRIVGMHEAGLSFREMARRLSRSDSTIIPAWAGLGPTKARKGVENVVVGHELRMNGKKGVFDDWLQLTRLRQLDRWRLLGGLFWKDRCLCEQFIAESVLTA
jgi:hypothetical protein